MNDKTITGCAGVLLTGAALITLAFARFALPERSSVPSRRGSQTTHSRVTAVAFSFDGNLLASGEWDGSLFVWNVNTGKVQQRFNLPNGNIDSVNFSPNGMLLTKQVSSQSS